MAMKRQSLQIPGEFKGFQTRDYLYEDGEYGFCSPVPACDQPPDASEVNPAQGGDFLYQPHTAAGFGLSNVNIPWKCTGPVKEPSVANLVQCQSDSTLSRPGC